MFPSTVVGAGQALGNLNVITPLLRGALSRAFFTASPSQATGRLSGRGPSTLCLSFSMRWHCRQDRKHGSGLSPRQETRLCVSSLHLPSYPRSHSATHHRRPKTHIGQSAWQSQAGVIRGGVYAMAWLFAADLVPNNLSFIHSADETAVPGGEAERGRESSL